MATVQVVHGLLDHKGEEHLHRMEKKVSGICGTMKGSTGGSLGSAGHNPGCQVPGQHTEVLQLPFLGVQLHLPRQEMAPENLWPTRGTQKKDGPSKLSECQGREGTKLCNVNP